MRFAQLVLNIFFFMNYREILKKKFFFKYFKLNDNNTLQRL